ncbi:MAG TPA: lipid A export permease/ATP-binding protein MsbA, partial [Halothiobacillus sp.]|nr:lipid A export permease/ATP-binding protein MsbA [Halothiobacillus sp.]
MSTRKTGWETYQRLLGYTRRYWKALLAAIVGMLLAAATDVSFAALMKPLLDGSFVEQDPQMIKLIPLALLGVFLVRMVAEFIAKYGMSWVGRSVIRDIRHDLFQHILHLPNRYFDRVSGGEILAKLNFHVEQVSEAASQALTTLVRDTLTVVGLLILMLYLSWQLAVFIIVLAPVIVVLIAIISRSFRRYSRQIQASMTQVSHVAEEAVNGQRVVKLYGGEAFEAQRFDEINQRNFQRFMRMQAVNALSSPLVQFILALAIAGLVAFSTSGDRLESITVGTFVAFITALAMTLSPVKRLINVNAVLQKGIAAGESLFALLDEPVESDQGTKTIQRAVGEVRFEQVWFRYSEDSDWVLRGVELTVPAGKTVALVGRSGSGKSTLLSLVPRFADPSKGRVLLDGVDLRELSRKSLRAQLAFVSQDIILFNTSVARNIAYGEAGDIDMQRVKDAAAAAYATEFIEQLPQGFDTEVGENGVMFSGGQRQRLAIARALYRNAPVLILDEATSALDTESERYIQNALANLCRGRTTLVIAHRLSTIEHADLIVVLDQGQIVEQGSHTELLARDGHYA